MAVKSSNRLLGVLTVLIFGALGTGAGWGSGDPRASTCDPSCKHSKSGAQSCTAQNGGECVSGVPLVDSEMGLHCCLSNGLDVEQLATGCSMTWQANTIVDRVLVAAAAPGYQAREEKLVCKMGLVCAYYVNIANTNCANQPSPTFTCTPAIPLALTYECHISPC